MDDHSHARELTRLATGYWISQAVYVAARLKLADLLAAGPQTADWLAQQCGAQPREVYRLLRALASVGVFYEEPERTFRLTPTAVGLQSAGPGSQRAMVLMMGEEHYRAYGDLLYSVQTGKPAFEKAFGLPVFDFLAQHPEQARLFDAAMTGIHGSETAAMLAAYDFSRFKLLADIGGGNGSTLCGVLQQQPAMQGLLFDLPGVIERARGAVAAAGLSSRCELRAGNFFEALPAGPDAYLMRHIIHDWNDAQAATILKNCRAAMPADGKLLVVESVIPPGNEPSFAKLIDLTMLAIPGGLERTEAEYRQLFQSAGLRLAEIIPTDAEISILEAVPG